MACHAVEMWTLSSLVGAHLDLALSYLFLIGATIAFFTSKLLSILGLSLPCSCDGHFGHPACIQTDLLIDLPSFKVTAVNRSLLSRFPYAPLLAAGESSSPRCRYASLPIEDRDSRSAASLPRPSRSLSLPVPSPSLRRRPCGSFSQSVSNLEKFRLASVERVDDGHLHNDDEEIVTVLGEESMTAERDLCSDIGDVSRCENGDIMAIMRSLERDFEEEKGARAALYLELEKERSAASTAADEAMAMILRLQKEKAEIAMESKQYHRMIEEKSVYDAEEMEILKEIIVRRERENHVLLQEVEMYKQMLGSLERFEWAFDCDQIFLQEKNRNLSELSDNPVMNMQQIFKSIGKKKVACDFGVESSPTVNLSGDCSYRGNPFQNFADVGKNTELLSSGEEYDQEFLEKNVLTTLIKPSSDILKLSCAEDSLLCSLSAPYEAEYHKDIEDLTIIDESDRHSLLKTRVPLDGFSGMGTDDADQRGSGSSQPDTESRVHDVHIINEGQCLKVEENGKQNVNSPEVVSSFKTLNTMEAGIKRSCSEISNRSSLLDNPSGKASYFDLRRSSLPFVDSEKYKLETEVEFLRKRLNFIREGREKLNLSTDHKEKEAFQLQLLDEIALQLKEIKKVTEPRKKFRRASLPPQHLS